VIVVDEDQHKSYSSEEASELHCCWRVSLVATSGSLVSFEPTSEPLVATTQEGLLMLVCVDVDYRDDRALAAGVLFRAWTDADSALEVVHTIEQAEPYVPGQFYKRELPCLLAVLAEVTEPLDAIVIDGYVWLQDEQTPGLGGHLYEALGRKVPVIGVAKTR